MCILSESTSNIHGDHVISCIDRTLERIYRKPEFLPELVITVGNSIISKKLKTLFREFSPVEHWHVEDTNRAQDVFSSLTTFLPLEPKNFLKQLTNQIENNREDKAFHDFGRRKI